MSFVTDNKLFQKTIKPFFSNKGNYGSQIKLTEKDDDLIVKELNEFFKNALSTLNITENSFITTRTSDGITDLVDKAIDKFHPSILLIQKHLKTALVFLSKELCQVLQKATSNSNIPLQIFKKSLQKFQKVFYINYLTIQQKRMSFVKIRNNLILNQSIRRMNLYINKLSTYVLAYYPQYQNFPKE